METKLKPYKQLCKESEADKVVVLWYKDRNGFISWFVKDEQVDNQTTAKTFPDAKKEILSALRQQMRDRILSPDDIVYKKAR